MLIQEHREAASTMTLKKGQTEAHKGQQEKRDKESKEVPWTSAKFPFNVPRTLCCSH